MLCLVDNGINLIEYLRELEETLPGLNYVISLELYKIKDSENPILSVFPKAVIGGTNKSSVEDMLSDVERCLRWEGDEHGSHPNPETIHSQRVNELVNYVKDYLKNTSKSPTSFWLLDGHPFYPVQWDFAYILNDEEIFIGSSSD